MKGSVLRERLEAAFMSLFVERDVSSEQVENPHLQALGTFPFSGAFVAPRPDASAGGCFQLLPSARGFLLLAVLVHVNVRVRKIKHGS